MAAERLGPYIIEHELGRGGMGVVFRARHAELDRPVALKVIGGGLGSSAAAAETVADPTAGIPATRSREQMLLARFRREAQAAGRLAGHPGIVGVHDVGIHPEHNTLYLAMELVEGRTLDDVIHEGDFGVEEAARLFARIAEAVHHAHSHGVLHRDLKPGNVLITTGGEPKVTDFGLAKSAEASPEVTRLTQAGELVGTPAYMAPEQVRGLGVDARTDVYALGVSLYETLAGRTPFEGDSVYQVVAQVVRDDPPPLRSVAPHVPAPLEAIVDTCLQKDPARRYATAAALAEDLERFRRGAAVQARGRSPIGRWWTRRGRVVAAAIVLAGGAGGGAWWIASEHAASSSKGQKAIDATHEQRTQAEQSAALSSAWLTMSQRSVAALRELQDSYYGRPASPEAQAAAVAALRDAATAAWDTDRITPQAWLALAEVYRRADGAWARLADLGARHPDNPLLQVLVAHGALAHFADELKMPGTEFSADVSIMADYQETAAMVKWRGHAATALALAAASPLWSQLDQSATVVAYAAAVRGMADGAYAEAVEALAPLVDDPIFGDEAGALAAFASLFAGRPDRAAEGWERVGRRGWAEALTRASLARLILASSVGGPDADPLAQFDLALRAAQGAEAVRPASSDKIAKVATVYWARALYRVDHDSDPMPDLEAAIAGFDRAAKAGDLGVDDFLNMAGVRKTWAKLRAARGFDPRPELQRALKDLTQALNLDPEWSSARRALGDIWVSMARYEMAYGGDPRFAFEQARVAMETVLERQPDDFPALVGLSNVYRAQADAEATTGRVQRATVERGLAPIGRAIALNPNQAETLSNAAILWRMLGECQRRDGEDPAKAWGRAVALLERALRIKPGNIGFLNNRALVHRSLGDQQRLGGGGDPAPHYRAAIADFTAALQAQPHRVVPRYNRAVNYNILAAVLAEQGADPSAELQAALADFDTVITANPNMWQALIARGHLHRRAGRRGLAIADYRATLKVNGKIEEARMWLQRLEQGR